MKKLIYALMLVMMLALAACGGGEEAANANKQAETLSERLEKYPHYSMKEDFGHLSEIEEILEAGFGGLYVYVPEEQYLSDTSYYTNFKIDGILYSYDIIFLEDDVPPTGEFYGNYCMSVTDEVLAAYVGNECYIYNLANQKGLLIRFDILDQSNEKTTPEERRAFADQVAESLRLSLYEMAKADGSLKSASEKSLEELGKAQVGKEIVFAENTSSYRYDQKLADLELSFPMPLEATRFEVIDRYVYGFGQYQDTQVAMSCFGLTWEQDVLENEIQTAGEVVFDKNDTYVMCVNRLKDAYGNEMPSYIKITITQKESGDTIWFTFKATDVGNSSEKAAVEYIDAVIESFKECLNK